MITFWRSNYNEFEPTANGGDITATQIESGVANSMILPVRPRTAEAGGERWFKFFAKTDIDIITIGIDIAKPTTCQTEEVYIALETKTDHSDVESDLDKDSIRLYGAFNIVSYDIDNKQVVSDRDVRGFIEVGDWVTFYDGTGLRVTSMVVSDISDDGLTLTFKLWTNKDISIARAGSSSLLLNSLSADDYIGVWIKEVIQPYTEPMEDPMNEFIINVWYDER